MSGPVFKPFVFDPQPIEVAPIRSEFPGGAVFQGAGKSHFTCDNGIFHETTSIPGFGAEEGFSKGLSTRFDINDIKKF